MKKYHWPRRVLSLLLCLVMALGFFPVGGVVRAEAATGYVTDNLVLHLDANNNTGNGFDPNATTWKNLASGGEEIKINGQTWGTDATYGSRYLDFENNYILLPDSVRQALSGTEFTIEFVLEDFVDQGDTISKLNNIMCVTGADSYIAQFAANGGTKSPGGVVNDNFVIFSWGEQFGHCFRTCYGSTWNMINDYASAGKDTLNKKTNALTFSSTAGNKWYQNGTHLTTGANLDSGKTITLDGYLEDGVWQTANKPQIAFGAATDVVGSRFFDAKVRAIRIYSDTLTEAEMKQNAELDTEKYYTKQLAPVEGYVTDNLVLYLDANNNTGNGFDPNATTWMNLAGGEEIKINGQTWGTDATYGSRYLDFENNYILLPDSVRQALSGTEFTIEFVLEDFVDQGDAISKINNIMCVTGADSYIAQFAANGGTKSPGGVVNDNFVIFAWGQGNHCFRTCYGSAWTLINNYSYAAMDALNKKTNAVTFSSTAGNKWYQNGSHLTSGENWESGKTITLDGYLEDGVWQTTNKPQIAFGAATDVVGNRFFDAKVRAIRIYSDTLTEAEMKQNAELDTEKYYTKQLNPLEGYVSDNLVLYLDANNNTGNGFDPNATTWKNLASGGEAIKLNGQAWGTDDLCASNYLTFTDDYILLPDSVRQALSGTEFTIEFVLDNFENGPSQINNIMCVTGADSYIAQFKANGGTKDPGFVVNDNLVIWSDVGYEHNFRTYYGNGDWAGINGYAPVGNSSINEVTNALQFNSTAGNKWYQDGTLVSTGPNYVNKTITLDGYLENGVWQTANKPQVAFGAASDVVAGRYFRANVRAIRIYADTLTEAEIKANAAKDEEKYYTVDESNLDMLAQMSWNAVVANTADLTGTSLAQLQSYAESKLRLSNIVTVTVADAGNGAFTFTYKRADTGAVIDTHTLYVDTEYTLDMAQLTGEQQTALMNDLAKFSGSGTIDVTWNDTAKAVNYTGTRNGNPVSHLYFPIYSSTNAYVYEAELSFVSGHSTWNALAFAADRELEHLQYAFWGDIGSDNTGAELVRFVDPAKNAGAFAVGHANVSMAQVLEAMGDKWQDTYTYSEARNSYTVTDTVTYKVVVYEDTVYGFIDGKQVITAHVTGMLNKAQSGVVGFNNAGASYNIHKLSVRPITADNEEEELAGVNLRFNPVKSFDTDIYEPDTDINTAPIVMQTADNDTKDVSGEAKRPSALIFDLKLEQGVLKAYDGETLLGDFNTLYKANQPKANVGVRIELGDTATADALVEWAKSARAGNIWVITNDVELLERMTNQISTLRGVVDFTGDIVRGPSDVKYVFDTDENGTVDEKNVVVDATLGKVNVTGGEYANPVAPQFTYKNYTGGYEARKWSEIYDILFTCGYRTVLLPESAIDKESVYQMQGSLVTVFVETDATTETEFYDLIVSGVNGILSTEYETNIAVLESDVFDVNGEEINIRGGHIVGHRGDMGFATTTEDSVPENAIEAIVSGAQSGISSVEFDVYLTLDGYLVLNHNPSIAGFFVYADDCPLTPEQRISEDIDIEHRYWKGDLEYMVSTYNKNIPMQQLYQLYEAVDTEYPELRLHHEAKDIRVETLNRIVDLMTDYGLRDRSDIMSTYPEAMQYTNSLGISSQLLSAPSTKDTPNRISAAETVYRPLNSTWHTQWDFIDTDYLEELKHYGQSAYPWATFASTYAAYYVQGYQGFTTDDPHYTDDIIRLLTPSYDPDTGKVSVVARTLAYHEPGVFNDETQSGEAPVRLPDYLEEWWANDECSHYVSDTPNEYELEGFEILILDGAENVAVSGNKVTVNSDAAGNATIVVRYKQALDDQSSFYIYSNTMTISAGKITGYDVTANSTVTYDGNAHASATVTEGKPADAEITFSWTDADGQPQTSTTVPSFTDVGVYDVSYTISKPNYADEVGCYRFEITTAPISALNVVAKGVEKVYDGAAAAPVVTAIDGATVEYSTDNQTWSTTAPNFTDVVETTVYYRVSKTGYETATGSVTVKITEATITGYKVESNGTVKFDGTEKASATVTTGTPADAKITYTVGNDTSDTVPKFSAVGTYEVSYTISKTNYTPITGKYTFTIEEGDITGYTVKANDPATYDGSAKVSATVTAGTPDDAEITYTYGSDEYDAVPQFTDAGTYTVSYAIWKPGYKDATGSYTFTINNAAASALNVVAKGVEKVYDGAAAAPSVTAIDGATVEYSTDNQTWSTTAPSFTDVVDATVYYRVSKTNYETATGSVTVKITEAAITGYKVEANDTVKYDGTEKISATVTTGTPADAVITYTVGSDSSNEVPKFTAVGKYTVSYTISKANYADVTGSYEFEIEEGDIVNFEIKGNEAVVYDGEAHISATVTPGIPADATIVYECDETPYAEIPSFVNAGIYVVNYTISKDGYNDVTGSYEFTIKQAQMEIDYEVTEEAESGDEPIPAATVGELPENVDVRVAVFADKAAWEDGDEPETVYNNEIPTFTEPGTYYLGIAFVDNEGNYETVVEFFVLEITEPAPETGDNAALGLWMAMLILSAAGCVILNANKKSKKSAR